jgi:hypothetical protein
MKNYTSPSYQSENFHCPHCQSYCNQNWEGVRCTWNTHQGYRAQTARCVGCNNYSIWQDGKMVYPDSSGIESPNSDLSKDIQKDYLEAASIVNKSPRGACALLRLAVEKLCNHFLKENHPEIELKDFDLHKKINLLIEKDLTTTARAKRLYRNLHTIKIIGNEAVHPGELDLIGDSDTAKTLFSFINMIAEEMITAPKNEKELFNKLPQNKTKEINGKISK